MATQLDEHDKHGLACGNAIEGHAAYPFDPAHGVQDTALLSSCILCDRKTGWQCPNCATHYCGRRCAGEDRAHHYALCQTFNKGFTDDSAPENHIRAILMPKNSENPKWVWIHLKSLDLSIIRALGITGQKPLKKAANQLAVKDVNPGLPNRKIGHGLRQFTAPSALDGGSRINKSIVALAPIGSLVTYFGSAIFLAFGIVDIVDGAQEIHYIHASFRDLRMIFEWYHVCPDNPCIPIKRELSINSYGRPGDDDLTLWPAVKIYCDGDLQRFSNLAGEPLDRIELVWVLSRDYTHQRMPSTFADMLELPWIVQLCKGTADPIKDKDNIDLLLNRIGQFWIPGGSEHFGYYHGQNKTYEELEYHKKLAYGGTIVVINRDGCQIFAKHIECFYDFIIACLTKSTLIRTDRDKATPADVEVNDEHFMGLITREKFQNFWEDWITKHSGEGGGMTFSSPYNTINMARTDVVRPTAGQEDVWWGIGLKVEELVLEEF